MARVDGRESGQIRPVTITRNFLKYPAGSVLIEVGDTKVICTANIEDKVPPFLKGSGEGWVTAEYSMLPGSTLDRNPREATKGKVTGRTMEIQRLVGRSLRSVVDMRALGERTIWLDSDVIQADGGTRTASITGCFVALVDALGTLYTNRLPLLDYLAAVSVGILNGTPILDLNYAEDSKAQVDMNVVMTGSGRIVEVQGTAEGQPFSRDEMNGLMDLGWSGIGDLVKVQKQVLEEYKGRIEEGGSKSR